MEQHSLILSLIKEDLRCSKLVLGLSSLGLDAGRYHTELSTLVLNLMELEQHDELLDIYFEQVEKVMELEDVEDQSRLQKMAEDIYTMLARRKEEQKENDD